MEWWSGGRWSAEAPILHHSITPSLRLGPLRPEEGDNRSKLRGVITWILQGCRIVARVPQLRIKSLLGRAEGNMGVAPQRVDADRIPAAGVRPGPHGVNQVRHDRTLRDQLRGLVRDEGPLLFAGPGRRFRRPVGLEKSPSKRLAGGGRSSARSGFFSSTYEQNSERFRAVSSWLFPGAAGGSRSQSSWDSARGTSRCNIPVAVSTELAGGFEPANDISRRSAVTFHERGVPNRYTRRHASGAGRPVSG